MSTFAETLAALRTKTGTTQYRLAKRIGVVSSAVSRWESGDRHPTRENVAAVVSALGLLPGDAERLHRAAGYDLDIETFRRFPADVREKLVMIGEMMTRPGAA